MNSYLRRDFIKKILIISCASIIKPRWIFAKTVKEEGNKLSTKDNDNLIIPNHRIVTEDKIGKNGNIIVKKTSPDFNSIVPPKKWGDVWFKGYITPDRLVSHDFLNGEPFFGGVNLVRDIKNSPCTLWEISASRIQPANKQLIWVEDYQPPSGINTDFEEAIVFVQYRIKVLNGVGAMRWLHCDARTGNISLAINSRFEGCQWELGGQRDPVSGFTNYTISGLSPDGLIGRFLTPTSNYKNVRCMDLTFFAWWLAPI